jgi:hypothetical protein
MTTAKNPHMKAWIYDGQNYDDELYLAHAATRGRARQQIANEIGIQFIGCTVVRYPKLDDLPFTAANLLRVGACGWYECAGCYKHIYPADTYCEEPWSYDEEGVEQPALLLDNGAAFCCRRCIERNGHPRHLRHLHKPT